MARNRGTAASRTLLTTHFPSLVYVVSIANSWLLFPLGPASGIDVGNLTTPP